ncbi:MAG: AMP-binding protein [Ilumatobacteraceae bacterium]
MSRAPRALSLSESMQLARRLGWLDPTRIGATAVALARWGPTLAAVYAASATRHPDDIAIIDDRGSISHRELDRRSSVLASGLRSLDLGDGHLGVLCTNHAGFVEVVIAASKASIPVVLLNTGFAAPQLREVITREGIGALACDADLLNVVAESGTEVPVIVADGESDAHPSLEDIRGRGSGRRLKPSRPLMPVLLTSGTTGTPKGARREARASSINSAIGLLHAVPYTTGDVSVIPTPLFHAWGFAQLTIAATTGSTAVLVRRFTPHATLAAVAATRGTVLAVVPVMLQRILAAPFDASTAVDTSTLRIVATSGSALPASVALEWMDRFGDNLYNMYGSTEVGQATLATPRDLREAPGTAGRVIAGTTVEVVDSSGAAVGAGESGLIVVGNDAQFSGYTGGGTKEQVRGLMSSGDVGHFDVQGRLFVTGRADDMIVSGGENVFPQEIEDVLLTHADIEDAVVVGVPDPDFGQRLAALIVVKPGASLDADAVRSMVRKQLARHKVPRDVTFVDEIPRNTTGKVLRAHAARTLSD